MWGTRDRSTHFQLYFSKAGLTPEKIQPLLFQSVDFDLTNTANMLDVPMLSNTVRGIIVDQISYYMVLPNKLPIQLAGDIDMTAFKHPMPAVSVLL